MMSKTFLMTKTVSVIDISATITTDYYYRLLPQTITASLDYKYLGGVLAPNGIMMIYFIPHYADSIGEFNPVTNTFSIIDISSRAMGAAGQRDFGEIQT